MKEELEKMKEQLIEESKKWQRLEQELKDDDSLEGYGRSYKIGSHPKTNGLNFEDKENGSLNIFMLCIITLVIQVLFLTVSFFIFK